MSAQACSHCGSENDSTRVFCGNCGTRLPAVEPEPAAAGPGGPGRCAPPISKPFRKPPLKPLQKPAGRGLVGTLMSLIWSLIVTAFLAGILAGLVQMVREPDQIPARSGASTAVATETVAALRELGSSTRPITWAIKQSAINEFLAATIQGETPSGADNWPRIKFERAFVRLESGRLALGIERSVLNRSLYVMLEVVPESLPQGLDAKVVGGTIGRLPVPPALLPVFLRLFQPTITGLTDTFDLIRKAKSVTVTPADITLQWAGTASR